VDGIFHVFIGDAHGVLDVGVKTAALFLTAALLLRLTERRTLAEFAPFDWIAAVAAGAIVGRSATASDTSWLGATTALICLLLTHAALTRMRFVPGIQRLIDPPLKVLIRDGQIERRNLRRCGLTVTDLEAVLRQHGHRTAGNIHLAIFEAKGAISILPFERSDESGPQPKESDLGFRGVANHEVNERQ
jgi:uncharacterized membrane protein YcaP (DUF421 family)